MITRYSEFLDESLLMTLNESIIYYSPKLRKILLSVSNKISDDMLGIEGNNVVPDMTYLDISKDDGCLSYITMKRAKQMIDDHYDGSSYFDTRANIRQADDIWNEDEDGVIGVSTKSRNLIRIGRLVNQLFPKKYSDREIEEFVNQIKSSKSKELENMKIISGDEISHWYDYKNYKNYTGGQLGNSCMKSFGKNSKIFDIYTKNPEVCRMLILVEEDKLLGRALIWKVSGEYVYDEVHGRVKKLKRRIHNLFNPAPPIECEFTYFMDRIYTTYDSDMNKFKKYAEEQGWAMRRYTSHSNMDFIIYKGEQKRANMTVSLNPIKCNFFPFMDTFRSYNPTSHTLHNSHGLRGNYTLGETDGGYG